MLVVIKTTYKKTPGRSRCDHKSGLTYAFICFIVHSCFYSFFWYSFCSL